MNTNDVIGALFDLQRVRHSECSITILPSLIGPINDGTASLNDPLAVQDNGLSLHKVVACARLRCFAL